MLKVVSTELKTNPPKRDENAVCEVCGRFGAFEVGDRKLCVDCYQNAGSCCPEFGADDLWQQRED